MQDVTVRFGRELWRDLLPHLFSRYPEEEWATWINYGWRESQDSLILTAVALDHPSEGELDCSVGHVAIQEPYSLRIALQAEAHPFAVGVAHSHPKGCAPIASLIDDDMDAYYSDYLGGFTKDRPYPSLIFSDVDGEVVAGGRVWWRGRWNSVKRFVAEGYAVPTWIDGRPPVQKSIVEDRVARLAGGFGRRAALRLRNARIGVVGAGGTGSPAIELLARAGVGHITVVDPDVIESSNLERLHGAYPADVTDKALKVDIARRHVNAIDPEIEFEGLVGRVPQSEVVDALVKCDIVLGCTDRQYSRLALSELAFRYLLPVVDIGVALEGSDGMVSAQIIQLLLLHSDSACVVCRGMIDWTRVGRELMSDEEQTRRRAAALEAIERGDDPLGYWRELPQLNTVGYLATAGAALGVGCVVGLTTGAFPSGFERAQFTLFSSPVDLVAWSEGPKLNCVCRRANGVADLVSEDKLVISQPHWSPVRK